MPLKVVIVGAGLGGLGAAIALRRAGHDVQVIEQSSFYNEVGAAIHIAPNATRILREWECDFEALQASECEQAQFWDSSCNPLRPPIVCALIWQCCGNFMLTSSISRLETSKRP